MLQNNNLKSEDMAGEKCRLGWAWSSTAAFETFLQNTEVHLAGFPFVFLLVGGEKQSTGFERAQIRGHFEQVTGKAR